MPFFSFGLCGPQCDGYAQVEVGLIASLLAGKSLDLPSELSSPAWLHVRDPAGAHS